MAHLECPGTANEAALEPAMEAPISGEEEEDEGWGGSGNALCVICWAAPRQTALAPCDHRNMCLACLGSQSTYHAEQRQPVGCPTCRAAVHSFVCRVYSP